MSTSNQTFLDTQDAMLAVLAQFPAWHRDNETLLSADLFTDHRRFVFDALSEQTLDGKEPCIVQTTTLLRERNRLDICGGAYRISELFSQFLPQSSAKHYLDTLRRQFALNQRILGFQRAIDELKSAPMVDGAAFDQAVLNADSAVEGIGKLPGTLLKCKRIHELAIEVVEGIEERMQRGNQLPGVTTSFPTIDKETGGMQAGRLWVVAGKPGDGKSVMLQNFLESALAEGKKVRLYPLEMTGAEQTYRILCSQSGVDNQRLATGQLSRIEQDAFMRTVQKLSKLQAEIVDTAGASAGDIIADIEQSDADIVMVDYLQLMEQEGRKGGTREEIVASISRGLKRAATKGGKVVLTASQLNDNMQLRESRAIGQDADVILMLNKVEDDDGKRVLSCEKNRSGKRGWKLKLDFAGHLFRFAEGRGNE